MRSERRPGRAALAEGLSNQAPLCRGVGAGEHSPSTPRVSCSMHLHRSLLAFVAAFALAAAASAQPLTKAADNHIFAQKLVDELMAARSDLIIVGVHARAPGAQDSIKIATNEDNVGR